LSITSQSDQASFHQERYSAHAPHSISKSSSGASGSHGFVGVTGILHRFAQLVHPQDTSPVAGLYA